MRRVLAPALAAAIGLTAIGLARGAVIVGTSGHDRLIGTSRADELYGLGGMTGSPGAAQLSDRRTAGVALDDPGVACVHERLQVALATF